MVQLGHLVVGDLKQTAQGKGSRREQAAVCRDEFAPEAACFQEKILNSSLPTPQMGHLLGTSPSAVYPHSLQI